MHLNDFYKSAELRNHYLQLSISKNHTITFTKKINTNINNSLTPMSSFTKESNQTQTTKSISGNLTHKN
jgi:hypothetical protein